MTTTPTHSIPPDDSAHREQTPGARAISTGPPRITPLREMQLVEQHRAGDPDALSELLQSYQRRVYSVCYRMVRNADDAADLAQDALIKFIEGLDRYDGRAKLSTWVIRITINCCISHLRKQKLRRHQSLDGAADRDGQDDGASISHQPTEYRELSADQRIEQNETREQLNRALGVIDPEMRAILVLRDMQGLEYEQLAEALDIPVGTVKSRLFRARAALRDAMEGETKT